MNKNALIWDDEELYRSVRSELDAEEYTYQNGKLRIRSNAFRDISKKPSVDRAKLRDFTPFCSRLSDTDGIVSLTAGDIRAIIDVKTITENIDVTHVVDAIYDPNPDPDPENYAHSLIVVAPEFFGKKSKKEKTFYKLKRALARLATKRGWTLVPREN